MEKFYYDVDGKGLTKDEMKAALLESIEGRELKNVLIIPPDFTRFHSNAGFITNVYYHALTENGVNVDILPALGTHVPVTEEEIDLMFGDIPYDRFLVHNWRKDVVEVGQVPAEFKSTWLGNKSVYRTRMAIADGGELLVLAPGVERFGEDDKVDELIRKYGYVGRMKVLEEFEKPENQDLRDNMGAAAHLIHGSSDGRFIITYAVKNITQEEVKSVGFEAADYDEMIKRYDPEKLTYGYNTLPDGKEIYYIPNPALGLWINREKF